MARISLLTYMVVIAISVSLAFNIDTTKPHIYAGETEAFFGYKVLQFMSAKNKGILVSAPLHQNGSGQICRYVQEKEIDCYNPRENVSIKHFGLSIAEKATHRDEFTACSPSLAHECYENSYLNSVCYQFKGQLKPVSAFRPAFQDCTKKTVDLVFLFDGSGSMTFKEFEKNKDFIVDIMNSLKNSSTKFAAIQFSSEPKRVFDFNDYQKGNANELLSKESHMSQLTNTYKALSYVMSDIFDNPGAGSSPDAIKVVVIITDGDPSDDDDYYNILEKYEKKDIIRFVIGVKNVALVRLYAIASEPKKENTFHIEDYNGLAGILKNFEKKIFNIEGTKTALAGNLADELSQSGFSATYHKDTLVLGSVGSNDWRGCLYERHGEAKLKQIQDPNMKENSYMGYSVAAGEKNNAPLYFTGAPRFEHKGQVVLFRWVKNNWTVAQRVKGGQIGSYFGAELCTVDVDSDNNTDFLLVGAPLFHHSQEKREGQIYIYTLTNELQLTNAMKVSVPSRGRFGTTISSLADLNGDGLRDVAVGAPLEDDNRGAVYIYLGDKDRGIRNTSSQRIVAEAWNTQMQFFGQAVDGSMDLGEDGLADIVVGSRGRVVVLRSRPVISVSARLWFEPAEISTFNIDCLDNTDTALPMVILTACFNIAESTSGKTGALGTGLNISYTLDVDQTRQIRRGFFAELEKRARSLQSTVELRNEHTCFNHSINMPKCVKDTLSPILIKLNFSQHGSNNSFAILNTDSVTQAAVEVPFEKNCKKNDTCIAELEVDFNFTTPTLLVVDQSYFNVTLRLSNHGDDSYNTSLTLHYPPGLSFSMMNILKATRSTMHSCNDLEGVLDKTTCGVNLPVYYSRSAATFQALFRIINTYEWNTTISMTVTGKSDNENSTRGSMTKTIPVQFQIDLAVQLHEDSISYLNFTPEDSASKRLVTVYEVKNLGFKALPVTVSLIIPTKLEHNFEMKNYQVSVEQNKTQCKTQCNTVNVTSSAMSLPKLFTGDGAEVLFKSFIKVVYDKQQYVQASSKQENGDNTTTFPQAKTDVRVEFIISPNKVLIVGTGVGGGLLLLIIIIVVMFKMGCFKRKTLQYYQDQDMDNSAEEKNDQPDTPAATDMSDGQSRTDAKSNETAEAKPLLDNGGNANDPTGNVGDGSDKTQDDTTITSQPNYANVI
ncbi:integrin alpha-M isoform 2-T2 [Polymixia lowei]